MVPIPADQANQATVISIFTNETVRRHFWHFRAVGKRPARILRVLTTGDSFDTCTDHPTYESGERSRALLIPTGESSSLFQKPIPKDKWDQIVSGELHYCIYALIEYEDVSKPKPSHMTKTCMELSIPMQRFTNCHNSYNDAD